MKCKIHTFLLNEAYSQELADKNNNGKPSEDNQRFEWEDELEVSTPVASVVEISDENYLLQGTMPDGSNFSFSIPNMRLVKIESTDAPTLFVGCSESILDELIIKKNEHDVQIEIYLKDYEPLSNPIPGIYIASKSFPKELIF